MDSTKRNLEFLYEMGTIRYIPRVWRQFLNKDFANLSEHHFRVAWIAAMIAKEEGADAAKAMQMALVHDVAESRTGDVHYLSRMYTKRDEDSAVKDIFVGTSFEQDFLALAAEYEARMSLEARIVKDADNIDCDLEIQEQEANGIRLKETFRMMRYRVHDMLFTATAKRMWEAIQQSNPHDWHMNGTNRFTQGDWKKS